MALRDRIQIQPRSSGVRNDRGNLTYTWPEGDWFWLEGVGVAPATSNEENTTGRTQQVITGLEVYSEAYDIPVRAHDRALYEGVRYEVRGRVGRWRDPFTLAEMGSMFRLEAITDEAA